VSLAANTYDPGAVLTPANLVTMLRLVITLPFLVVVLDEGASWAAFVCWFLLCLSDCLDGYLARRHGVTRSGAFLDPLADKVLVLGAMWVLVAQNELWALPIALITVREVGIQGFRTYWGRQSLAVPASYAGKLKTLVQEVAVGWVLFPPTADRSILAVTTLWIAVALTLVSGAEYVYAGRRATRATGALSS
jgi:CDP-diacylglycerol--glycerol-3-phosphate 3-phosphatidyltransferase